MRHRRPTAIGRSEEGLAWKDVFKLLVMAGIPIVPTSKQPDLGTAIIMLMRPADHAGGGRPARAF